MLKKKIENCRNLVKEFYSGLVFNSILFCRSSQYYAIAGACNFYKEKTYKTFQVDDTI
jgi:hypothetical protein